MSSVEELILSRIKPRPEEYERLEEAFVKIKSRIEEYLEQSGVSAEATLQGSVAHDTWLSGDRDIDVFVLFPKDISLADLKDKYFKLLLNACSTIGACELRYAEHPYVRLRVDEVVADVVPAYKLSSPEEVVTAVDRTPFHTQYVNSKLSSEMRDQVRLLKKFMKGIGVYGAEIKTRGFSGYVVELLIIVYGGFRKAVEEFSKWRAPVYVNTLDSEEEFRRVLKTLRKKYRDSPIYMPDPVDPERNATANVSISNFAKLVVASSCYLRKPSTSFFEDRPRSSMSIEELSSRVRDRCIVLVELSISERLPPDVLWGELWRTADRLTKVATSYDFSVIDYSAWTNELNRAIILLEVDECVKRKLKVYRGPEYWSADRVLDYLHKHVRRNDIGPWISRDGSLVSLGRRKYWSVEELLIDKSREYLVAPHFRDKRPVVKVVSESNVGEFAGDEELFQSLVEFVVKRPPWMKSCID